MEKQVPLRLSEEEYEWLRRHSFETRTPMVEICRMALKMYRESIESDARRPETSDSE